MEEARGKEGSRYQTQCKEKNIRKEASKTCRRPKVNAESQIPQQKSLSIAPRSIRTFVQEWVFYQFGFVTLFYNRALFTKHCSERRLSLSSRKAKWCKRLAAHLAYSPDHKKSQQKHKKNCCCTSNQASQMPVVGTAERLEKTELWGINSPIFLQKIFEWQGNVPMRLQMGNKPEKDQHLEILAVLV